LTILTTRDGGDPGCDGRKLGEYSRDSLEAAGTGRVADDTSQVPLLIHLVHQWSSIVSLGNTLGLLNIMYNLSKNCTKTPV